MIKKVIAGVVSLAIIFGACVGVHFVYKTIKSDNEKVCEHVYDENDVCEECGKTKAELTYNVDIVSKNCAVSIYVDGVYENQTFGAGVSTYSLYTLNNEVVVQATSGLSSISAIKVYQCVYTEDGVLSGYKVDENTTHFAGKKYNEKKLVKTLTALDPVYTLEGAVDGMYIFEYENLDDNLG